MTMDQFQGSPFSASEIRWDDATDGAALCNKLNLLSRVDQPEPLRGLSLFVRSHLSYAAADADEAAHELLDLMCCGENRAWLASLAGNVQQKEPQEKAADLCVERLEAGSKSGWHRALSEMSSSASSAGLERLLKSGNDRAVSLLLWSLKEEAVDLPATFLPRIEQLALSDDEASSAAKAALLLPPFRELTNHHAEVLDYFRACFRESLSDDSALMGDHTSAAFLLDDPELGPRCHALLTGTATSSPGVQAVDAPRAAAALMRARSPILAELLSLVCSEGRRETMRNIALALGKLTRTAAARDWLDRVVANLPNADGPGETALAAFLGYTPRFAAAWEVALSAPSRELALLLVASLAHGGDIGGMMALFLLERAARDTQGQYGGDAKSEPSATYEFLRCDLAAAISRWAWQPTGAAPLRWRILAALLQPGHERPDDLSFWRSQGSLLGMAELCRSRQMPTEQSYAAGPQVAACLSGQLPLARQPRDIQRVCAHDSGVSVWGAEDVAHFINTYWGPDELLARMMGGDLPLEDDQQKALAEFEDGFGNAASMMSQKRHGEAVALLGRLTQVYERVPYRGTKRASAQAEVQLSLARCYKAMAAEAAEKPESENHTADSQETAQLAMKHARRALASAERAGNSELTQEANEILGITPGASSSRASSRSGSAVQTTQPPRESTTPKSSCFIATAVYGSPMAREVQVLRECRDTALLHSGWGRALVRVYEKIGPRLAKVIAERPLAREITRRAVLRPALALLRRLSSRCR